MYPEETRAVNGYDVAMPEKPASMRDELRNLYHGQSSAEKRDDELSERINQLAERVSRLERVIGE